MASRESNQKTSDALVVDDMFDVPLNDARSYVGQDDSDMLTSQTSYAKVPSKPGRQVKVGSLAEDQEYSFDVDL